MWLLWWLIDIVTSPIRGVATVIKDVSWDNWEDNQLISLMTLWASSVLKGTAEWIKKWADEITE